MALSSGSKLGHYEILSQLGAGGMGEVYRARDPRIGREVAVKVLPSSYNGDPNRLRRFEQEARAAGALNHPNEPGAVMGGHQIAFWAPDETGKFGLWIRSLDSPIARLLPGSYKSPC